MYYIQQEEVNLPPLSLRQKSTLSQPGQLKPGQARTYKTTKTTIKKRPNLITTL